MAGRTSIDKQDCSNNNCNLFCKAIQKREDVIMISSLIAGFSLLILSGVANTYISYLLFGNEEAPTDKNNV
ncbi:hypothetical protein NUACC21_60120 [Scytonema sp. NUACC21]